MKQLTKYLIVRSDGDCRVINKRPRQLRLDEVAFCIHVSIPDGWGAVQRDSIDIAMPEPPEGASLAVVNE